MKAGQAVPLAQINETPFVALSIADAALLDQPVTAEINASILNIEHEKEIYAIAFVQFRLNNDPRLTYTVFFNLHVDKQYQECLQLLAMQKFGLFLATDKEHDFIEFKADFSYDFDPRIVAQNARAKASDYSVESFLELSHFFYHYHQNDQKLWAYLHQIASADKEWYAYIKMASERKQ